ncbi:cyclopropane-fatty-acyl-phospholipid synthase [Leptospira noguchii str. 1993005606]|uniref:Cyclopropane-fatty-acyl-phospholipid synthase n=2 Tax=Leptospira noguchii TaxID=28182 RepID=M6YD67_9LEPT|nr:cyclopropane-fatty-acyl-phospholipid synthase family protein [Leptospira noguchii]EMN02379.1 cyclopropane-fatty-acyl-phospholipid synthase [Leptospira noguchii str. 2007001578]EMO89811.1 cyclopropane-fatty-acyl-phospholipid synthase [Leptospira noguchii str. 2001034031]EPE84566.1 cyclopropane-fatty-acyl-phospholipid synthase [Leptospira noguchii str. 1993005606]
MKLLYLLLEKDIFPDWLIRFKIRRLLAQRLKQENQGSIEANQKRLIDYVNVLKQSPIAVYTKAANEQHYEVPAEFFKLVMGKYMKYSSGYWETSETSFDESERKMLEITCQRAKIQNGMSILDLGCGWGSLSLYLAENFPKSQIVGVSNSKSQKKYIDEQIKKRRLKNLKIITADMNEFKIIKKFDRLVSVEMLEHMRNYEKLFERFSSFLKPEGLFFVHIFTHHRFAYPFEIKDDTDWMSRYFFTGGQMPSHNLFLYFQKDFQIQNQWAINGTHYANTSETWLSRMYQNKTEIINIFMDVYGDKYALKWFVYWKVFFMACAELWKYKRGEEWIVSHYLFSKR